MKKEEEDKRGETTERKEDKKGKSHSSWPFVSSPNPDTASTSVRPLRPSPPCEAPVQASTSEPPRPEAIPPPAKPTPKKRQAKPTLQTPPARRYLTRSGGRPLQKRARVESSEPIDLTRQSPVPSPVPSPAPSPVPSLTPLAKPQTSQPPPPEPQILSEPALEAIISLQCSLSLQFKAIWTAELGHSILSCVLTQLPFSCAQSLKDHFNCCEDIKWSSF
ncbi:anther-specific proline-rich protein APG-like [Vitis riparia]|uniref:anther-specific proline-rich protein APG-like n=1 Tax=Vitis riparia TaxID=96939 RepID=UPI00155A40C6|nr:anther-specific proline-rich protein APG-like [Vitis riparia]